MRYGEQRNLMLVITFIFLGLLLAGYLANKWLEPKSRYLKPPQIERRRRDHLKIVRKDETDK